MICGWILKCNARKEEEKRTSSPSPTNTRTTTNGKASNNRPFDCNAFFFSRSLHPCGVLSLLLSFSRALSTYSNTIRFKLRPIIRRRICDDRVFEELLCLPLTSSSLVCRSRLALCLSLSLSTHMHTHAHDQCART